MEDIKMVPLKKFGQMLNLNPDIIIPTDIPEIKTNTTYNTHGHPCGWVIYADVGGDDVFVSAGGNVRVFKTLNAVHAALLSIGAWQFTVFSVP